MKSVMIVKKIFAFINSIAALHVGLAYMGHNILNMAMIPITALPYVHYIFGVSGALYLVIFGFCFISGCGAGSCNQGSSCGCGMMGK